MATPASVAFSASRWAGQRRIGLIGRNQRFAQRVGRSGAGRERGKKRCNGNITGHRHGSPSISESEGPWPFKSGKWLDIGVGDAAQPERAAGTACR